MRSVDCNERENLVNLIRGWWLEQTKAGQVQSFNYQ